MNLFAPTLMVKSTLCLLLLASLMNLLKISKVTMKKGVAGLRAPPFRQPETKPRERKSC
jgi:hypothetical protein